MKCKSVLVAVFTSPVSVNSHTYLLECFVLYNWKSWMSSAVTVLFPAFGCPEMIISFPSKLDHASLYFKFVGSASGSAVTLTGSGGGCPSRGTLERSAMSDRRLFCAVKFGSGSDSSLKTDMGPITSLTDSAGASRDSVGTVG